MIVFLQKKKQKRNFIQKTKKEYLQKKNKTYQKSLNVFYLNFATALRYGTAFSNS